MRRVNHNQGAIALSKIVVVAVVAVAIAGVVIVKQRQGVSKPAETTGIARQVADEREPTPKETPAAAGVPAGKTEGAPVAENHAAKTLPKLVDLGAGKCVPCRALKPILDGLREEYKGRFDVVFIDVWENRDAGAQYGIRVIPTQIFYDETGKERFRHEGFFSREDILKTWKEIGYTFD